MSGCAVCSSLPCASCASMMDASSSRNGSSENTSSGGGTASSASAAAAANWTVQQLAPDPNPKLHKTQHLIGTIGSDYLFAKIWLLVCKTTQNESKFDVAVVIWLPRLPRPQRIPWACWRLGSCQWKKYKTANDRNTSLQNCAAATGQLPLENLRPT